MFTHSILAEIQRAKGRYDDAERLYERALSIYERALGANDPSVIRVLNSLAIVYFTRGDYRQSERAFQRILSIRESSLGAEHLDVAQALYNLADFYEVRGSYNQAEPLLQRALTIRANSLGRSHPDVSLTLTKYSCVLRKANRAAEADALERDFPRGERSNINPSPAEDEGTEIGEAQPPRERGVLTGTAINRVDPVYPVEAREQRASGQVVVRILVDESGRVINACAVSGHRLLLRASEQAVYRWRFTPTLYEGTPVRVRGTVTINFELR